MSNNKLTPVSQLFDKHLGKRGTKKRDELTLEAIAENCVADMKGKSSKKKTKLLKKFAKKIISLNLNLK